MSVRTPSQQKLLDVWQQHLYAEFATKDVPLALSTMTEDPYVLCVPVGRGGYGVAGVRRFYAEEFFPNNPADMKITPVAQAIADDALIDESVISFTHDVAMPWLLPGIAPTGRRVEFGFCGVIGFRGDKIHSERLYWDQATLLVQLGVLAAGTPSVCGAEAAKLLLDPSGLR
jgi:carboxymethylenebutenolidase